MNKDPRIHVNREHLQDLGEAARGLSFLSRQPAASVLNGRHASHLRGRGLNFEEMRNYLPGDDVRSIDWKATARTGKPHVRVFTEERDRPALLVVDQRMSMFFGTRLNLKSVTAAEAATIAAFRILASGDRVGGIVFDDEDQLEVPPRRSRGALESLIGAMLKMNNALHADRLVPSSRARLNDILKSVARIAHHDHLVIIFSDFDGIDESTQRRLSDIATHNDLILMMTIDPIALSLEAEQAAVLGDGSMQAEVDLSSSTIRGQVAAVSERRLARIHRWQQEINLTLLQLSTGEETLTQIRRQLGGMAPKRRTR
jgi:uncharacterized protein (DUF58 family)